MLSHSADRIKQLLKGLILRALKRFNNIATPEPIILKELFGGYKNQEGVFIELPEEETLKDYTYNL